MADPEYFFAPVADIFTPIATYLQTNTGFSSYFLEQSKNHALERWDWLPTNGSGGKSLDNPGRFPARVLDSIDFRVDVACRSKTFDGAWKMLQQFLTAARRIKHASGHLESWRVEDSSDQGATLKTVVTITYVWTMPLLEQPIDRPAEAKTIAAVKFDTTSAPYGVDDGTLVVPLG